jgi:hypothetical protein
MLNSALSLSSAPSPLLPQGQHIATALCSFVWQIEILKHIAELELTTLMKVQGFETWNTMLYVMAATKRKRMHITVKAGSSYSHWFFVSACMLQEASVR